jgi:hypothetical protein
LEPAAAGAAGRLDFLGLLPVSVRKLQSKRVGFSWISLDSLVRIVDFQWVTRIFHWKNFRAPFLPGRALKGRSRFTALRSSGRLMAHPSLISGFLKEIVVWTLFPSAQIDRPFFQSFIAPASA